MISDAPIGDRDAASATSHPIKPFASASAAAVAAASTTSSNPPASPYAGSAAGGGGGGASTASASGTPVTKYIGATSAGLFGGDIKLYTSAQERESYENLADLYSIIVAVEQLERAYIRDAVPAAEYTTACQKLIAQYKTALNLADIASPEAFMAQWDLHCPAARKRLIEVGVPATFEHGGNNSQDRTGNKAQAKYSAETVQCFITLMDSLKLNMVAVDEIHPQLSDLIQSLNRIDGLPATYEGKSRIRDWLVLLNKKKASDQLDDGQVRQLLFDLESAHTEFHRFLDG
ncbi:hypothetical protein CXG81DRAFT_13377 [Caulochytrium protostelioides]|uniref:Vacuolar protein sorting-associated protein 28 n=1 Tax=Caulochytrium protostelioides TaxID=1555241 RepID=A0A4P9X5N6_9FUNG|nr:hypothetical protein CXG81DRAFT_13377 [Caulochytrium protostelioides]|eukprot:RKP00320.1 hypothetical protein CXG81DRAFT_13377 [Caulochytrium protostelioides]